MDMEGDMNKELMAKAFTEWMRRYIEEPDAFEAGFNTVIAYLDDGEASYGEQQAEYLTRLMKEVEG